jgi:TRAP-type C4-dicarboxylate transport system substrate-binding protein
MFKLTTRFVAVAVVLFSVLVSGAGNPEPAMGKELKLAHFMPPGHVMHRKVFAPLAAELAKVAGGELTIRIYPSGALGKGPVQQYKRAIEGVADITFGIQSYTASIFPRSLLLTQPGVARTAEEGTEKFWDNYSTHFAGEYKAVEVLGIWVMFPTTLITRSKPVRTLADMKGMKVRIGSPALSQLTKDWGAVPVVMPVTKAYNSLNTGIVDAVLIQPSALYRPWNLAEPAKYVTDNLPGPSSMVFLIMNKNAWKGLSGGQRATLKKLTGREFSVRAGAAWDSVELQALEKAKTDKDVEYIRLAESNRTAFANAALPAIQAEVSKLAKKGIDGRTIFDALMK